MSEDRRLVMSAERKLVTGRVRTGPKKGHLFVGVQNDAKAYERLTGGLTGDVTHALIVGDENDCLDLIRILVETMLLEDSTADLLSGGSDE